MFSNLSSTKRTLKLFREPKNLRRVRFNIRILDEIIFHVHEVGHGKNYPESLQNAPTTQLVSNPGWFSSWFPLGKKGVKKKERGTV